MTTPLGLELRRLRKDKGYTLEEVAENTGITKQYLSLLENGKRKAISFEIMISFSNFYGVPLDYFKTFTQEDEQKPLSEKELMVWNTITEKVYEQVYYKNSSRLIDILKSFKNKS